MSIARPCPAEARTYELTAFKPENNAARFSFEELTRNNFSLLASAEEIPYEQTADSVAKQKRLIEHVRTLYRPDDLGLSRNDPLALLPLGQVQSLALAGRELQAGVHSRADRKNVWRQGHRLECSKRKGGMSTAKGIQLVGFFRAFFLFARYK